MSRAAECGQTPLACFAGLGTSTVEGSRRISLTQAPLLPSPPVAVPLMEALAGHLPQPADLLQRGNSPALEGIVAKPLAGSLRPAQRKQFGGVGPCAFLDPRRQLVPKRARQARDDHPLLRGQARRRLQAHPPVHLRQGAFGRQVDKNEQITEDLNHFTVKGAAAAVAWAAMKRRGVIPR